MTRTGAVEYMLCIFFSLYFLAARHPSAQRMLLGRCDTSAWSLQLWHATSIIRKTVKYVEHPPSVNVASYEYLTPVEQCEPLKLAAR